MRASVLRVHGRAARAARQVLQRPLQAGRSEDRASLRLPAPGLPRPLTRRLSDLFELDPALERRFELARDLIDAGQDRAYPLWRRPVEVRRCRLLVQLAVLRFELVDADGQPIAGATVTFAVGATGGTVSGASQTTDALGIATVGGWTLGSAIGVDYTLVATVSGNGIANNPITFTARTASFRTRAAAKKWATTVEADMIDRLLDIKA